MAYNIPTDLASSVRMDLIDRFIKLNHSGKDTYMDIEKTLLLYFSKKRYSYALKTTLASFKVTSYVDDGQHYYYIFNLVLTDGYKRFPMVVSCTIDQLFVVDCGPAIHITDARVS